MNDVKLLKTLKKLYPIHEACSLHVCGTIYILDNQKISVFTTIGSDELPTIEKEPIKVYVKKKDSFINNLEEFYRHAMDTWPNSIKLANWLNTNNEDINNMSPVEFATSNENLILLDRLLYKIEFTTYFWNRN